MTLTLSKHTEAMVRAQLETGRYATPDEVINRLIEERLSGETSPELPPGPDETELKSSLLGAVGKPVRPYVKGELVELARRAVAEDRST